MYKVKNKVYADAGKLLVGSNKIGYVFYGEPEEFYEESIRIDDMHISGVFLVYSNNKISEFYKPNLSYEELRSSYIKRQFSEDDQLIIILNKDNSEDDMNLYNKLREWREWCEVLAKKVSTMGVK